VTPAVDLVRRAGIRHRLIEYANDTDHGYGTEAASALGVPPDRVFKTLVARLDGRRLVVALVPVSRELDLKALAGLAGAKRAELAPAADAERATGYVVGGISPLGQRRRLPTYIDEAALASDAIYVSGGRRGLEIELAPGDLCAACAAVSGAIARPRGR